MAACTFCSGGKMFVTNMDVNLLQPYHRAENPAPLCGVEQQPGNEKPSQLNADRCDVWRFISSIRLASQKSASIASLRFACLWALLIWIEFGPSPEGALKWNWNKIFAKFSIKNREKKLLREVSITLSRQLFFLVFFSFFYDTSRIMKSAA